MSVPDGLRTQPSLEMGEVVSERYRVERRLGVGGMGEAYLADDLVLHRKVTLKRLAGGARLDQSSTDRLLTEAKRATAITSPHIAQVFDVCRHSGELLLVLEFIPGVSLRALLGSPLPSGRFFSLAVQLAESIQAAHAGGVLHCDIKPENIIVTDQDFVKVLDFGLAQILTAPSRESETVSIVSGDSTLAGTPGYMAPEVLREAPPTEQSDIFAMGIVFYEMASGKNPYKGKTFADSVHLTLSRDLAPLDLRALRLPEELNRILLKMLMRLPEQRYATVRDLLVDLRSCQQQVLVASASTSRVPKVAVRQIHSLHVSGKAWKAAAVVSVCFIAIAAMVAFFIGHRREVIAPPPASAIPEARHSKLVVVIPFQVVGGDKRWIAYGDGLREALTSSLARVALGHSVEVLAASEVRSHALTTAEMARRELGADLVIEGSLQAHNPSVRVDYSLVNASGHILSADHVTSKMTDPFALEDQVVQGVLGMLEVQLGEQDRQQLAEHGTQQGAAYESYLQGIGFLRDFDNAENLDRALHSLEQAIQIDPKFARAYAGLGEAHWAIYKNSSNESQIELAKRSCQTGSNLDPNVAEVYICLGQIAGGTGQVQQAVEDFDRASKLNPSSDEALNGMAAAYEHLGRAEEAERVYRSAIDRRPYYWANYYALSNFLVRQAKYAEAETVLETAVGQFPSNSFLYRRLGVIEFFQGRYGPSISALKTSLDLRPHADAYGDLGLVYLHQRRFPEAIDAFEKATKLDPKDYGNYADLADAYYWSPDQRGRAQAEYQRSVELAKGALRVNPRDADALMVVAYAEAALGRRQEALKWLNEVLKYAPEDAEVYYYAARIYARLGDRNSTLAWLHNAVTRGYSSADMKTAPDFELLHDDSLFR